MTHISRPQKAMLAALLGAMLFVAQSLAVAHAYQHDLGSPVDATCASCVIGGQLAAGCAVDAGDCAPQLDVAIEVDCKQLPLRTVIIPAAKQRGPPV